MGDSEADAKRYGELDYTDDTVDPAIVAIEKKNRIRVALAAYAYEFDNAPFISDGEYDKLCLAIRPEIETGNPVLDKFFREEFDPNTGVWVHNHPEREKLRRTCAGMRAKRKNEDE